ncbi:hypothetical protein [Paraliomyxa miuraensis]|uniref:hypothetical protein n=1 Tax=Paraliomyxa miuraensis TaxID=376150 RepID=UPI0022535DCD|nr:hypothetical protein [Paraliomyxa miuraensis]MCX4241272.1 hypothetical protein [Paraliomyxa miuraensis]
MMRKIIDLGIAAALVTALWAPDWARATEQPAQPVADAGSSAATMVVPVAKVEIQHQGRVIQSKPERLSWDEPGAIRLERGDRIHDVTLAVSRKEGSGKLHVTLTYELDGELVIEGFTYDTKAKKREVLRTDGVALAITVTTKPLEAARPTEREDKLEPELDPTDPLAGL